MSLSVEVIVQFGFLIFLAGCYLLALSDHLRLPAPALQPARPPARRWTAFALVLVMLMLLTGGLANGSSGLRRAFLGAGWFFLVQALALAVLIPVGWHWAGCCNASPFDPGLASWRRWPWRRLTLALIGMLLWTVLLMLLVPFRILHDPIEQLGFDAMSPGLQFLCLFAIVTLAPIVEECLFRHYLPYRLAFGWGLPRLSMPLAILFSSAVWSIGHYGLIEPFWLKWLQTFMPGIVLGGIAWKVGLEAAIVVHWVFNLCMIPLAGIVESLSI